jgi:hypothetical protein
MGHKLRKRDLRRNNRSLYRSIHSFFFIAAWY